MGCKLIYMKFIWLLYIVTYAKATGFNECFHLLVCLQGNQEASNPADAMAQTYTPQFAHPPQNGIHAEFTALPTQDYAGQNRVPDHGLTLYTPAQTHSDLVNADSNTPAISSSSNTAPVGQIHIIYSQDTLRIAICLSQDFCLVFQYKFLKHSFIKMHSLEKLNYF